MAFPHLGKVAASFAVVSSFIVAVASCDDQWDHDGRGRSCDYVVGQQCQTVCDYYCDPYQCYPTCYDQCWDQCGDRYRQPSSSSSSGSVVDSGGIPSDASTIVVDGGTTTGTGTGVLCTSCISNDDCESGALCILRGGPPRDAGAADAGPVGRGFCGHSCTTSDDCPSDFLCSQIGSSRQCLPTGNSCE